MTEFNVRAYGALGDGKVKDTMALQQCIDAAASAGGGTVMFPAGTYVTGTLYLDHHVHLQLEPGAVILGSPDPEDYNAVEFCPQNECFAQEHVSGAHLIVAVEKQDVGLHGGRIDGHCGAWMDEPMLSYPSKTVFPEWRPGQMLYFCQCQGVRIDDLELVNSPYWACFLHGCDHVFIRGVNIENDIRIWNSDGIDVDCCHYVTISDCQIRTGDDSITIRAHEKRLLGGRRSCQWITVSNCLLSSTANAFRIGVGDGEIHHCTVSNCQIYDTRTGICIINKYSNRAVGAEITDISFENIQFDCVRPLMVSADVHGAQDESSRPMRNISFRHLRGKGRHSCFITGNTDCQMSGVTLSDVIFDYEGGDDIPLARKQKGSYGEFGVVTADAAIYLENVRDIELDRVRIRWNQLTGPWRKALQAVNVTGLVTRDCLLCPPTTGGD